MIKIANLTLNEEQFEIIKNLTNICDVKINKNIVTEEKSFIIPIKREELVIEKISLDGKVLDTIIIPLAEEKIEINKTKIFLEDVNIYKEKLDSNEHFYINLLKEKLKIEVNGEVVVTNIKPQ
ncbi:MAG: hypothetical protein K0S51_802 [Bacillales bacterium]|jgi:uncharacterized protein (TIGR02271 family)|nr:hypothetical protein [Bacillales bacterium]